MYRNPSEWSIVAARREFAALIRAAEERPQLIKNRNRLVAVVVDPAEYVRFEEWRSGAGGRSVADAFDELRSICREESYELLIPDRADRPNPFVDEE
jgi:prevent-host-death family protein